MPLITTEAQADAAFRRLCPPTNDPTLDAGEIADILAANVVGTIWAASTAYTYGDIVIPLTRNGHRYKCIVDGTSDTTEPNFRIWDNSIVADGSTLIWKEIGPEGDLWNIRNAAFEGWQLKAAKASCRFDYDTSGDSRKRDQVYQHCIEMANRYMPIAV